MLFVKVLAKDGEATRRKLAEQGIIDTGYRVTAKDGYVYIPVAKAPIGFETYEFRGTKLKPRKPKSMDEALHGKLTAKEIAAVTSSFDILGDIAIIEVPEELESKQKLIAEAVMAIHPNIKVVAKKLGGMEGEFRVRPLEVVAGEKRTVTEYRESGTRLRLDVATVFFSVRLSHERERIAAEVKDGEKILALFAGVGPFPLVIANANKGKKLDIAAIELNPEAVKYMEENVRLNHAEAVVKPILGDARKVVLSKYKNWADRVIMPLPKNAEDFLDVAFAGAKKGGVVHFYTFVEAQNSFELAKKKINEKAKELGVETKVVFQRIVRPFSASTVQVVIDFQVVKKKN
jgi:tRNA (guanine37-N1)-methyltransferase